jgi:CopA family copper-resistance protein
MPTRRRFVEGLAVTGVASLFWPSLAPAAQTQQPGPAILSGDRFDLTVGPLPVNVTGRRRIATVVNGSLPAPTLQFREGDTVTINVTNRLSVPTSIHWHGILLPSDMDGVPGLSFRGIMPGETFTYRFPVKQAGTYWYHSHSGMQEQTGMYGALILVPREKEPYTYDRDYVIVFSDWTDEDPMTIVSNLKQQSDYYNYQQRTVASLFQDAKRVGFGAALRDRMMWGQMRMSPTDIMDVTGATYTFLVNGQPPAANWTALFNPGEKVRLRFINGSSMTTFDVRIPGLPLTVVAADGNDVEPVTVAEFRMGVAETYDVIVEPRDAAFTVFAQAQDRSGYARATLAPRAGMTAAIPPMSPRPLRTMADMGMGANHVHGAAPAAVANQPLAAAQAMAGMDHAAHGMAGAADMTALDHAAHGAAAPAAAAAVDHAAHGAMASTAAAGSAAVNASGVDPRTLMGQVNVDNVATQPMNRMSEPGTGLQDTGRRTLVYTDLKALKPDPETRPVDRDIEFHLTGNMERWVWGFDGKKFSEAGPVRVKLGERVRFVLINNTMMEHPIHLHGFLFSIENGQEGGLPLKHTVNVKPGERMSFVFTADTPGYWAFHCHLLYHMDMGMFRTVLVA